MFRKINIPITGTILNQSHFTCSCCSTKHQVFGSLDSFHSTADDLSLDVLGQIPIVPDISTGGDTGVPIMVQNDPAGNETRDAFRSVAKAVWKSLGRTVV